MGMLTIGENGRYVFTEKKSRFIASAKRIETENEAVEFINSIRREFSDAKHNVYVYVCGNAVRYSDDGEPHGTSAMPVYEMIKGRGLDNLCVVITRYFGGILLGKGGLSRAYGEAAAGAVENAGIYEKSTMSLLNIETDYSSYSKIKKLITDNGLEESDVNMSETVSLVVAVPSEKAEEMKERIVDLSFGRSKCALTGEKTVYQKIR